MITLEMYNKARELENLPQLTKWTKTKEELQDAYNRLTRDWVNGMPKDKTPAAVKAKAQAQETNGHDLTPGQETRNKKMSKAEMREEADRLIVEARRSKTQRKVKKIMRKDEKVQDNKTKVEASKVQGVTLAELCAQNNDVPKSVRIRLRKIRAKDVNILPKCIGENWIWTERDAVKVKEILWPSKPAKKQKAA